MKTFREFVFDRHDNYCNQKYATVLPYSFHLKCVEAQGRKFEHLVEGSWDLIYPALLGHDIVEDGRFTYNDVVETLLTYNYTKEEAVIVAEIIYTITDEKGKTRAERKNEKYYRELGKNRLAVFVKLADISANTLFSKLTGSSMYDKYKSEFKHFKEMCFYAEYEDFFSYIESL